MNDILPSTIGRSALIWVTLFALCCLTPSLRSAEVPFNTYTSPTDNDLVNKFLTGGTFQQMTAGGITGGAVASQSPDGGFATYRTGQAQPTTVSISFLYDGLVTASGGASARLGWVGDLSSVDFFTPSLYFWGEFYNDGQFSLRNNPLGGGGMGSNVDLGSIATPTAGHWLQLSLSATPLGGEDYQLGLRLDDLGTSGLDSPNNLFSGGAQVANGLAAADSSIYAGFFGYYRAPLYDNFSVQAVPEPSSMILFGLGATVLWIKRRHLYRK